MVGGTSAGWIVRMPPRRAVRSRSTPPIAQRVLERGEVGKGAVCQAVVEEVVTLVRHPPHESWLHLGKPPGKGEARLHALGREGVKDQEVYVRSSSASNERQTAFDRQRPAIEVHRRRADPERDITAMDPTAHAWRGDPEPSARGRSCTRRRSPATTCRSVRPRRTAPNGPRATRRGPSRSLR